MDALERVIAHVVKGELDEAIDLVDAASAEMRAELESLMLGDLFSRRKAAGSLDMAARWWKRGIDTKGYSDIEYRPLEYSLAVLYHSRNINREEAKRLLCDLYERWPDYRDVKKLLDDDGDWPPPGASMALLA